jgi:hypothetical protein
MSTMTSAEIDEQHVWEASETPDLERIAKEFERAGGLSHCSVQKERNDRIRFCRWKGRTSDYKKHRRAIGREPVPYEDAWDSRPSVADDIMEDLVDVAGQAFRSAQFQVRPNGKGDPAAALMKADAVRKVMVKYTEKIRARLNEEADYMLELALGYGECVGQVGWDRRLGMRMEKRTMEQITQAAVGALNILRTIQVAESQAMEAEGAGEGARPSLTEEEIGRLEELAHLPELILDPAGERAAAVIVQTFARDLAAQAFRGILEEYGDDFLKNYELPLPDARRIVRALREEGAAAIPAPYVKRNQPYACAREVGYDLFLPPETTELDLEESTLWVAVREWLRPGQIRESQAADGWDKAWCDAAIAAGGKVSQWTDVIEDEQGWVEDDESDIVEHGSADTKSGLVEVVYFYAMYTTPAGIPQLWCTIYCPHALRGPNGEPLYAKHSNADGQCYFYEFRPRKKRRSFFDNQGLPEQVGSDQQSIKNMIDMLVDRANLEVNPPLKVRNRLSMRYKMGPGSQVPEKREGEVGYLETPTGNPQLAFNLIEFTYGRLHNKFGLMREGVLPSQWQMKLGRLTERFLLTWQSMFGGMLKLIQEHGEPGEIAQILGVGAAEAGAEGGAATESPIAGEYDVCLYFDVKNLDYEFLWKKLEAITKTAVPLDRAGVIDVAQLVKLIMLAIDPTYAAALVTDKTGASQAVFKDVRTEVALMYQGNEADYVENDPAAAMKLKFLDEIVQGNPEYMEALGAPRMDPKTQAMQAPDPAKFKPRFQELLQKYQQNLQQSVKQEDNKMHGRLGMKPGPGYQPALQG